MRTMACKLVFVVALSTSLCSVAQTASTAAAKLASAYSLTGTGFGSAERITDPGTVYMVHVDGLLARAIADHVTPTNIIVNGKLLPPAKGFRAAFGASGDVKQVQPDQRFYLHAVEAKDDGLVFTLLSLDSINVVADGGSSHSRLRLYLKFQLSKQQVETLTPEWIHMLTDPIFSAEGSSTTATVHIGQSEADVRKTLGSPDKVVDLGRKELLVYKNLKVTLQDGKVTDAE